MDDEEYQSPLFVKTNYSPYFKRFDAGLRIGIGFEVYKIFLGLNYDLGLADIAYSSLYSTHKNLTFSFV